MLSIHNAGTHFRKDPDGTAITIVLLYADEIV